MLMGSVLCGSYAGKHSYCVFMSTAASHAVSRRHFTALLLSFASCTLSVPSFCNGSEMIVPYPFQSRMDRTGDTEEAGSRDLSLGGVDI